MSHKKGGKSSKGKKGKGKKGKDFDSVEPTKFFDSWVGTIVDNRIYEDDIISWTAKNGGYDPLTQSWKNPIGAPGGITSTTAEWEFSKDAIVGNFLYVDPTGDYAGHSRFVLYGDFKYNKKTGELKSALIDKHAKVVQARSFEDGLPELDYELHEVGDHKVSGDDLNNLFHFDNVVPFYGMTVRWEVTALNEVDLEVRTYELKTDRLVENPVRLLSPMVDATIDQFLDGVPNGRQYFEIIANGGSSFLGDVV